MSCTVGSCSTGTGITCGTGGWNGPKPGDPDNNSVLSATPAFGGIDVTWTYPATNPYAVSHINVYRGNSSNPDLAVRRGIVTGTYYYDKIPSSEIMEYFYWIQIVSTNGTYGEWIGPVSAVPKESISEVIQELTGRINEGVLAESLRTKIGEINILKTSLNDEINSRLTGNAAIADALSAVQSETAQAVTYINQEITQRATADEALLNSVNVLAVGVGDNTAAIANESLARATDMSAVAAQINTVQTTLNGQIVGVETTMGAAIQDLEQTTDALGALYTVKLNANGLAGGFGLYNDGSTVQAGFDVDTFWVGRSSADQLKPFVVDGDQVFLSNTVVPTIQSNNYEPGSAGWIIRKEGPAEFQDIIIRGGGVFGGTLSAAVGSFSGELSGATGTFSGRLTAGTLDPGVFAGRVFNYNSPGTYTITVPSDTKWTSISLRATLLGGGGGGGCGSSWRGGGGAGVISKGAGGGGGAGSLIFITLNNLTPGATYTLVVGAGGGGAPDYLHNGYNGAATTLNGYSANGGVGGQSILNGYGAGGSLGGVAGRGDDVYLYGGNGGSSSYGSGGGGPMIPFADTNQSAYGNSATGYGSGGSGSVDNHGANANRPGGNGTGGMAIVEFYDPNSVVTNIRYSNLITWLDGIGHGAVPSNAR